MTPQTLLEHLDKGLPWPDSASLPEGADVAAAYQRALAVRALRIGRAGGDARAFEFDTSGFDLGGQDADAGHGGIGSSEQAPSSQTAAGVMPAAEHAVWAHSRSHGGADSPSRIAAHVQQSSTTT